MENKGYVIHQYHQETGLMISEDGESISFEINKPDIITVPDTNGRILMRIDHEGNYHGELDDASEAARVFCRDVQELMRHYAEANQAMIDIAGLKPRQV